MRLAITTKVHESLLAAYNLRKYNVYVLEGSSRSSKTHSIIQFWIKYAFINKGRRRRVAICRLKGTWLSATVLNDFVNVLSAYGLYDPKNHNKTNKIIKLYDTEFWFLGLDDAQKAHGFASDALWINEGIECGYDDYAQLMQRCTGFAIIDYNPSVEEHWIYDRILKRPKTWYNHSTFRDNRFISTNARDQILSYEPTDENYEYGTADERKWKIYGLGQRATLEGLIYDNWELVKEIPVWAKTDRTYGLDFGFTNSYTTIIDSWTSHVDNKVWIDEVDYRTGLLPRDISTSIIDAGLKKVRGIADSAQPGTIEEIYREGINIHAVKKGSNEEGIDNVKGRKLMITERSVNVIREIKNYTYAQDKNGIWLNVPVAVDDHAMDAIKYIGFDKWRKEHSPEVKRKTAVALASMRGGSRARGRRVAVRR